MSQQDLMALITFGLMLLVGLGLLVRYERSPQRKVIGEVTRIWREASSLHRVTYYLCFVEIEVERQKTTYSCDPAEYMKLAIGQTVRLHLKGQYVEYLRVLKRTDEQP
ncbi:MAG TPA: hypothetical protein VD973_00890 [Symbiobacteriaceae bacterium]|nr:hypothetical protein [Symbiobacteriaceae bacterium]